MSSINSLKAIEHKIKELRAKAREIRREEQKGVEELRAVIVKYKLGFAHCRMAMRGTERSTRAKSTLAPKYRSLHNEALVWSGRGRKPSWIVAELRNGRKLDEFLIERSQQEDCGHSSAAPDALGHEFRSAINSTPTSGCDLSAPAGAERK